MLDFDSDAGTHGQFRPPTADRQMLLAMERSDVYVLKPAAPQRPWEFYRNMLPDVPQQGQNAPAHSSLPAPPLQRPNLVAHGYKLGPRGEPSPRGCQREAAAALWRLPKVADVTAFGHAGAARAVPRLQPLLPRGGLGARPHAEGRLPLLPRQRRPQPRQRLRPVRAGGHARARRAQAFGARRHAALRLSCVCARSETGATYGAASLPGRCGARRAAPAGASWRQLGVSLVQGVCAAVTHFLKTVAGSVLIFMKPSH
eukprot:scaffold92217_cov69-Phaeocystis_antarctica.AAC.2